MLPRLLSEGITPRQARRSLWKHAPSLPDRVYLTTAYAFYFAFHAALSRNAKRALVVEIDTSRLKRRHFDIDEDFRRHYEVEPAVKNFVGARLNIFRKQVADWQDCLNLMGNVSYRAVIPPEAITRYVLFEGRVRPALMSACLDPTINVFNYQFCGQKYRELTAWFFGDRDMIPVGDIPEEALIKLGLATQLDTLKSESQNREGITVCRNPLTKPARPTRRRSTSPASTEAGGKPSRKESSRRRSSTSKADTRGSSATSAESTS